MPSSDTVREREILETIIDNKTPPAQDTVQYISELTKYGFKNLFNTFGYNPALPYSSQVNPHAELFMKDYLRTHTNYLDRMKTRALPYFNLIDNILTQYGLPRELKYLAVIESDLKAGATSWVGAGGPWQLMPYTARELGLRVNNNVDERRDYFKSTHAAARYLLELYNQMHDWLLVIAAYNGGPQRVLQAIRKSGSTDFWNLQYYLPEESRNHVKKFIATHYIMEANGSSAGYGLFMPGKNADNDSVLLTQKEMSESEIQTVSGKFNSHVIAKNIGLDLNDFKRYNPDFDARISSDGRYDLRLSAEKMKLFLSMKYQILDECVGLLLKDDFVPDNKRAYPIKPAAVKQRKL